MRVQLTRKLAQFIDGIDLTHCEVGDTIELPTREALLLIAEGWAQPTDTEVTCLPRGPRSERDERPARQRHARRS